LLFHAYSVYGGSCTNSIDKTLVKLINLSHGDDACDFGIRYARSSFVQHCTIPETLECEMTDQGYIKTDSYQKTTDHVIFASGDNTTRMRTVANAVAMGTTAGRTVNKEIIEEEF